MTSSGEFFSASHPKRLLEETVGAIVQIRNMEPHNMRSFARDRRLGGHSERFYVERAVARASGNRLMNSTLPNEAAAAQLATLADAPGHTPERWCA